MCSNQLLKERTVLSGPIKGDRIGRRVGRLADKDWCDRSGFSVCGIVMANNELDDNMYDFLVRGPKSADSEADLRHTGFVRSAELLGLPGRSFTGEVDRILNDCSCLITDS